MPFDSTHHVVYGVDARNVEAWALGQALTIFDEQLNDDEGPYYEPLGLSEDRAAICTPSQAIAAALYNGTAREPIVFGMIGPAESIPGGKNIGGTAYRGQRVRVTIKLDSGVDDASPADSDPEDDNVLNEVAADARLAGFLRDIVRRNRALFLARGLHDARIESDAESQRAGVGRTPQLLTCLVIALDDYAPAP